VLKKLVLLLGWLNSGAMVGVDGAENDGRRGGPDGQIFDELLLLVTDAAAH
jgi:hypothetical protein